MALIDGKKYANGKLAEDASASRRRKEKNDEVPAARKGISPVLGGGKSKAEVEGNPLVKGGSLAATVVVVAALVFGATNPDVVEDAAAKSRDAPCIEKIVRGFKITCPSE